MDLSNYLFIFRICRYIHSFLLVTLAEILLCTTEKSEMKWILQIDKKSVARQRMNEKLIRKKVKLVIIN